MKAARCSRSISASSVNPVSLFGAAGTCWIVAVQAGRVSALAHRGKRGLSGPEVSILHGSNEQLRRFDTRRPWRSRGSLAALFDAMSGESYGKCKLSLQSGCAQFSAPAGTRDAGIRSSFLVPGPRHALGGNDAPAGCDSDPHREARIRRRVALSFDLIYSQSRGRLSRALRY